MSETIPNDPAILREPTCQTCGFQVPNNCVIGAGCPQCHTRIMPAEVLDALKGRYPAAAVARIQELEAIAASQAAELEQARALELKQARALADAIEHPTTPEGGSDAES